MRLQDIKANELNHGGTYSYVEPVTYKRLFMYKEGPLFVVELRDKTSKLLDGGKYEMFTDAKKHWALLKSNITIKLT